MQRGQRLLGSRIFIPVNDLIIGVNDVLLVSFASTLLLLALTGAGAHALAWIVWGSGHRPGPRTIPRAASEEQPCNEHSHDDKDNDATAQAEY